MSYIRSKLEQLRNALSFTPAPVTEPAAPLVETREKTRSMRLATGILLLALTALMVFASLFTPAVNVYAGGEYIGTAASAGEAESAAEMVAAQVSDILGRPYELSAEIETKLTVARRGTTASRSEIRNKLFEGVTEVTNSYALVANGEVIGAADSRAELENIIEALKAEYHTEGALDETLAGEYFISYRTVPTDTQTDAAAILTSADAALTVETVTADSYTTAIPYETVAVLDDTLYTGEMKVVTQGVNGERTVTLNVISQDGEFVRNEPVDSTVTLEPVTQVVAMGTLERPATASYGELIWPVSGIFSSGFGYRSSGFHSGIDVCNAMNTPIVAADGGEVTYAGSGDTAYSGYGNLIIVTHDDGSQTYYAHLNSIEVSAGQRVSRGEQIGLMGTTGRSTGVHLHFEVRINGTAVDPMGYLPA